MQLGRYVKVDIFSSKVEEEMYLNVFLNTFNVFKKKGVFNLFLIILF